MGHLHTSVESTSRDGIRKTLLASPGIAPAVKRALVSLPAWFPAGQAAAVLRHHAAAFAFVTDRAGISGTASLEDLAAAPRTKSVSFVATPLGHALSIDSTATEALASMRRQGHSHLPVVVGGLIIGMVTREALEPLATPGEPSLSPLAA